MSLLFDQAIASLDCATPTLVEPTPSDLEVTDTEIPVRPIAAFASHHDTLAHPEKDWVLLPLHEPESAVCTGEFLAFTDHSLHGPVIIFERDGDVDHLDAERFGRTTLARRIRFWHSDYLPEESPPYYDSPIADNEPPRNPVDAETLLDDLAAFVEAERDATRAANREQSGTRSAAAIYRQGGDAIPALSCVGAESDGEYRFRIELPDRLRDRRDGDWAFFVESEFGIYEGNEVRLHAPDDRADLDGFPVDATVARIRGLNLWLTLDWADVDSATTVGNHLHDGQSGFGLSALLNPVPFDREAEAIETLRDHPLREVLAGERPVTFSNGAAARSSQFDTDLNQEQQLAVEHALLADDLCCIHGPPGTGKTRTLIEVVRRAAAAGEDVLVCADSNQAVDNLLVGNSGIDDPDPQSLHAYGQHGAGEFELDRVGASRSSERVVRDHYRDGPGRADVVATTNNSAATSARTFDTVVIDEATQATCPASCIPIARARKVVLAGDHRQLPPYSATDAPPDSEYGHSLFEHLYADGGVYEGVGLQLQTQYRMHRDIAYFSNREFYDRTLRNGRALAPLSDRQALEGFNVGGRVETVDHSKTNPTEARLVAHLVTELLADLPPEEIGVISPYAAQVETIRETLSDVLDAPEQITVDTIDSFQGSERTAIVISLVRSNDDGDLGFLGRPVDGPRRLNVALTRAQRYCAVVGDFHTLRYDTDGKATDVYATLYDHFENTGRLSHVDPDFIPV